MLSHGVAKPRAAADVVASTNALLTLPGSVADAVSDDNLISTKLVSASRVGNTPYRHSQQYEPGQCGYAI